MSRKLAREHAYKLIFEFLFYKQANNTTFDLMLQNAELSEDDKNYMREVYIGVIDEYDEIMGIIDNYAVKYTVERILKPDLAAMLLSIYEMKNIPSIPYNVSINEAVDIVKKFSTEKSSGFVNGILASVYRDLIKKQ